MALSSRIFKIYVMTHEYRNKIKSKNTKIIHRIITKFGVSQCHSGRRDYKRILTLRATTTQNGPRTVQEFVPLDILKYIFLFSSTPPPNSSFLPSFLPSNSTIQRRMVGREVEGSGHGIIEILSQYFPIEDWRKPRNPQPRLSCAGDERKTWYWYSNTSKQDEFVTSFGSSVLGRQNV
jgi:hypothetical protein